MCAAEELKKLMTILGRRGGDAYSVFWPVAPRNVRRSLPKNRVHIKCLEREIMSQSINNTDNCAHEWEKLPPTHVLKIFGKILFQGWTHTKKCKLCGDKV